jgi:hypothetical protein
MEIPVNTIIRTIFCNLNLTKTTAYISEESNFGICNSTHDDESSDSDGGAML